MSVRAYDTVDEFLDHMMDLSQDERKEALAILEHLFCHCGYLKTATRISRTMISHSPCDHRYNEPFDIEKNAEFNERVRNHATLMRTRYSA